MSDINCRMPAVALRGLVCLPDMILHFDVSRKKSIAALEAAMVKDQMVFLVAQKDPDEEDPKQEDLYTAGAMAKVKQIVKMPENMVRVVAEGKFRAELDEMISVSPYLLTDVIIHDREEKVENENEAEAMRRVLEEIVQKFIDAGAKFGPEITRQMQQAEDIVKLTNQLCANMPMRWQDRQTLAEKMDFRERYEELCRIMEKEYDVLLINQDIQNKVKSRLEKNQRDYVLREQMKLIREELGDDMQSEIDEYEKKLEELKAPDVVKEKLEKEISRFKASAGNSAETGVLRTYIDTLFEMPWSKTSRDNKNIDKAAKILREDHYGLEKVKERILEFLSVRLLTKKGDSPILCLVGPPGTGKTSIARSIARALNKKYVRISLGGVHDEAEIRGHRRTYIGAMPGRIASGLSHAGVKNPVMLLDEIDKVSTDYKGDTFSALLEVLDSEQNSKFRDNYLELPLDLSDVLFIATANSLSTIPRPLLDRMEIIEVSSYTENEKYHIANDYLVKKQMEANGLNDTQIHWKEDALRFLITDYTREAGVRNLERRIGQVSRKVTRDIYQKKHRRVTITKKVIKDYLGRPVYEWEKDTLRDQVGIVHGLAWTAVGGVTLKIEVNVMPGKGAVQVTGSLGNVMKESAQAAISYIRSQSRKYKIKQDFFEKHDIHVHIPEGAVPKDGPSAGITMTTAVLSAITGNKVCGNLAMTGEVTIRGDVLMIGGLKEKLLAAKRLGITKVLVPKSNEKDVKEFEEEVVEGLEIIYVKTMTQVIKEAFVH
mgnify:CR=1 FL=1